MTYEIGVGCLMFFAKILPRYIYRERKREIYSARSLMYEWGPVGSKKVTEKQEVGGWVGMAAGLGWRLG